MIDNAAVDDTTGNFVDVVNSDGVRLLETSTNAIELDPSSVTGVEHTAPYVEVKGYPLGTNKCVENEFRRRSASALSSLSGVNSFAERASIVRTFSRAAKSSRRRALSALSTA